jgi:predicted nucleic acid-binding protein
MSRVLVDTSVFIETERRNLQALERLDALMEESRIAISVVTAVELLASPTLPDHRKRFYARFFAGEIDLLPVSQGAAFAGIAAAREAGGGMAADILIAGTALEHGLKLLTADAGLARLIGPSAELLRKS